MCDNVRLVNKAIWLNHKSKSEFTRSIVFEPVCEEAVKYVKPDVIMYSWKKKITKEGKSKMNWLSKRVRIKMLNWTLN